MIAKHCTEAADDCLASGQIQQSHIINMTQNRPLWKLLQTSKTMKINVTML